MDGLNAEQWQDKIATIAQHLSEPARLCLIGSAAGIFHGQPERTSMDLDVLVKGRTSMDLDVLAKASTFDRSALKDSVEKAGLLFDPKGEIPPETPYVQIVTEGIVQVGSFQLEDTIALQTESNLDVISAPPANLIAAKLLRGDPRDIEDIFFLMAQFRPDREDIEGIIETFPAQQRERAQENTVYLDLMDHGISP